VPKPETASQRNMRGLHATYDKPSGKQLLSYWLAKSGKTRLENYCGKYVNGERDVCANCGHVEEAHETIEIADCVYYSTDGFGSKRQSWRVVCHYRRGVHRLFRQDRPSKANDDWEKRFIWDFISGTLLESKMYASEAHPDMDFTYCFVWEPCKPEEAEAVGLVAVCGAIAPLVCCEFNRVVNWKPEYIQEAKDSAAHRLKYKDPCPHSDFMWTDEPLPESEEGGE